MNPLLQSVQLAIQDGTQVEAIAYIDKLVDFCIANENGRVLPGWPRELIQLLVAYHIAKDTFVAEEDKDGKIEGLGMWYHCDKDEDDSLITEWKPDNKDGDAIFIGFLNAVNNNAFKSITRKFLTLCPDSMHKKIIMMRHRLGVPTRVQSTHKLFTKILTI